MTDIEAEVRKLTPEDGDVIVLRTEYRMPPHMRQIIGDDVRRMIEASGKKVQAILLEDGISIEILRLSQLQDREVSA